MSCKNKCRNNFKGIENFLRRVAFNLGNTPSQTEVKIISCIPIDVTDLQQKIISLEKELEKTRSKPPEQTATNGQVEAPLRQAAVFTVSGSAPKPTCCSLTRMQDHCAARSTTVPVCTCWSDTSDPNDAASLREELTASESSGKKSIFKKLKKRKDKLKKKDKNKPQLVYYAQTSNYPFHSYENRPVYSNSPATDDTMSRAYISEMIRKQYTPVPIIQDCSIMSEFSSPICRDVEQGCASLQEPDACSCCRGPHQDVDHQRAGTIPDAPRATPALPVAPYGSNTGFYDTTLYDMIPVRERPIRTTKVYDKSRRRSPKSNLSGRSRSKTKIHVINHHGRAPATARLNTRKTPARFNNIKEKRRIYLKREIVSERHPTETSNSCCIDCGNVYVKRVVAINKPPPPTAPKLPVVTSHRNVECLTHALNDSECQTTTTQSVQIDSELLEEKTEATLNQIKTILQTVLTEVKTNTQLKQVAEDKSTKDAVVQKGASQGNMPGCSSLLHSYTYSPYNMNPYQASCSRQMTSRPCCFPNYSSGKYTQNFPVFIQTPGRHMCSSCYRNSSDMPKMGQMKQANTMATNTDSKERSKETEKLIKEIYKSMTVNMNFPGKDTSVSECNEVKCSRQECLNKPAYKPTALHESVRKFVKVIESRNVQQSTDPLGALNSKLMSSNTMSMRSQIVSTTDTERRLRNNRLENYLKAVESQKRQKRIEEEREYEEVTPETTASDEEPTSSSDTEEHVIYTRVQDPTKKTETVQKTEPHRKGLFMKMLKSVKLFHTKTKKKEEQVQVENEEDEESENSDDYQTVYSQRVEHRARNIPYPVRAVRSPARLKAHSKISYSRHMRDRNQEKSRRSPYMEQEYRRHWNERFHEHQHRYCSEGQHSSSSPSRPVYWQNYEARSALVKPVSPPANDTKPVRDASPTCPHMDDSAPAPNKETTAQKGLAWLKRHKLGIHCGPQWKKFILEG